MAHTRHTKPAYLPPRASDDPVAQELVFRFLDGLASVTDAFRELRDDILPNCERHGDGFYLKRAPGFDEWLRRWNLDSFEDGELNNRISWWASEILQQWKNDPKAAMALRTECGWTRGMLPHTIEPRLIEVKVPRPEPDYESLADYRNKIEAIADEIFTEEMKDYRLEYYNRRDQGSDRDFEWLALAVCKQMSAGQIAVWTSGPKSLETGRSPASRETIKKALDVLYKQGFRLAARKRRKTAQPERRTQGP